MAERRCANCPPTPVKPKLPPVSGLVSEDGKRLWHHALVTCNAVVEMMHVYTLSACRAAIPATFARWRPVFWKWPKTARKTMRIPVPHSDSFPLVSIILFTPKGEITATVDDSHYWVDIPLPEGVQEDEVDVYSCFLGAGPSPALRLRPGPAQGCHAEARVRSGSGRRSCSGCRSAPVAPAPEPEPPLRSPSLLRPLSRKRTQSTKPRRPMNLAGGSESAGG